MSNKVEATFHPHPSYTAMEAAWARHHERQTEGEPDASKT